MGTKIKGIYILLIVLLISAEITGQNKAAAMKKYAFYMCLEHNYVKIDSTFYDIYKDKSSVGFAVKGKFNENNEIMKDIINYTDLKTSKYYSLGTGLHSDTDDENIIFCYCFNFYESKELDAFVKKLLKKSR